MGMGTVFASAARAAYRVGLGPASTDLPDQELVRYVTERGHAAGARALDLGCGTGRNSVFVAANGWDVTGVDLSADAVDTARRRADAAGVAATFLVGDVSRLGETGLAPGFELLIDGGCFHLVAPDRRADYVAGVSALAAPGALLILVGFRRGLGPGLTPAEMAARFVGWEMDLATPIPPAEVLGYVAGPHPARYALRHGWFQPWRYRFRRLPGD